MKFLVTASTESVRFYRKVCFVLLDDEKGLFLETKNGQTSPMSCHASLLFNKGQF